MLNFSEEFYTRPYMVMQQRCVWNKTFLMGNTEMFIMLLHICHLTATCRKASNATGHIQFDIRTACHTKSSHFMTINRISIELSF